MSKFKSTSLFILIQFFFINGYFNATYAKENIQTHGVQQNTDSLIDKSWQFIAQKRYLEATEVLSAITREPMDEKSALRIGLISAYLSYNQRAYKKTKVITSAINSKILKTCPDKTFARYVFIDVSVDIDLLHTAQAEKKLKEGKKIFLKSTFAPYYYLLEGEILLQKHAPEQAARSYNRVIAMANNYSPSLELKIIAKNKLGSLYLKQNNLDLAIQAFTEALTLSRDEPRLFSLCILSRNNLSLPHTRAGNYSEATQLLTTSFKAAQKAQEPCDQIESLLLISSNYLSQHLMDSAITNYHQALKIAENNALIDKKAHIYKNLGLAHQRSGNYERATYYLTEATQLYNKLNFSFQQARAIQAMGNMHLAKGDYVPALEKYIQALHLYQEISYDPGKAGIFLNLGLLFDNIHNTQKALSYYTKGLSIQEKVADNENLAYAHQLIGNTLLKMKRYTEAVKHYEASLNLRQKLGTPLSLASSYQSLGNAFAKIQDYSRAINFHTQALELRKKHNDISGQANTFNALGNIAWEQNQPKQALTYYKKAMELANKTDNQFIYGLTSRKIGELYLKLGKTHLGLGYINNSLQTGININHAVMQEKALEALYLFYQSRKDLKSAFSYYLKFDHLRDSLKQLSSEQRIIEVQKNFELEQKNNELTQAEEQVALLTKTNKQQQTLIKRKNQIQYLLFGTALLLIAISLLIYFQWKQKRAHNILLSIQNEEMEQINAKLRKSEQALKNTNSTKDKFFSIIAHDLRNPFMALYSLTDQVVKQQADLDKAEIKEHLLIIKNAAEQLLELLENLLYWSRAQRGKIKFTPTQQSINQMISDAKNLQRLTARNKNIDLNVNIVTHSDTVTVDQDMLRTILRNLLSNAIKFSHPGSEVRIVVSENNEYIKIQVIDQGIGMSESKVKSLFRLEQKSTSGTANEHGTGLGLVLCKEFVEKHGGKIWAESIENKGTIIIFTLPKNRPYA